MNFHLKKNLILALVVSILASCSSKPVIQEYPESASPSDEISSLEQDMSAAKRDQVNILAPTNYSYAKDALEDAKVSLKKQKQPKTTLYQVAKSRAYLKRSKDFANLSKENLGDVIDARDRAIDARASHFTKKDFNNVEDDLRSVTAKIEKNNLDSAINKRAQLQNEYLRVELLSIKSANMTKEQFLKIKGELK